MRKAGAQVDALSERLKGLLDYGIRDCLLGSAMCPGTQVHRVPVRFPAGDITAQPWDRAQSGRANHIAVGFDAPGSPKLVGYVLTNRSTKICRLGECRYQHRCPMKAVLATERKEPAEADPHSVVVHAFGGDKEPLVEEGDQPPTAQEIMRLRDAVPPLGIPVDVIVMSEDLVRRRKDVPGSLAYWALREGRLIAES